MATTVTTVRKRGFFGWVFLILFLVFNAFMALLLFGLWAHPGIGTNYKWRGARRWPRHFQLVSGLRYPGLVGVAYTRIEDRHDGKWLANPSRLGMGLR